MSTPFPRWLPPLFSVAGRVAPRLAGRLAAELLCRPRGRNPPQDWELEPTLLAPRPIRLAGGLHGLAWGEVGPVVLAQHGWRGRPTQFGRIAAALVPFGYRVVALDAPGHGVSGGARASTRIVADTLRAAAAELGAVRAVIGHSFGGAAAGIAVSEGLVTTRLVLIASPTQVSVMMARMGRELGLPAAARQELAAWFDRHAGRPIAELDLVQLGAQFSGTALIVHDEYDEIIPVAEAHLLESAWPAAAKLYTRGLGHRELLAAPAVVSAIRDFVDGRAALRQHPLQADPTRTT
jgi:pimeloyl-ACP methyl ester carboxylesterase